MALDAVVFPQDPFTHTTNKDLYNLLGGNWSYEDQDQDHQLQPSFDFSGYQTDQIYPSMVPHFNEMHIFDAASPTHHDQQSEFQLPLDHTTTMHSSTTSTRAKRRRAKSRKNNEEIENQRIIHIAVERNRRKQMNEYLSVLRSLMPESYVQKGDQASIIGGAINFVKELEQHAQFLGHVIQKPNNCLPFSDFFTFPQYSTRSGTGTDNDHESAAELLPLLECKMSNIAADIEVAMVESHVSLKVRSKKLPKQLLKIVSGLEAMRLTVLHLNVVTADDVVLYSLSLKVEDECMLSSVDEIAAAVHQMLATIQQEAILN